MDELILVDIYDREIGSAEKAYAHEKGLLHRAFSVFLVNGNKMLIQKRNVDKYHSGGLWANACCSHPRKGETLECAVHRRMAEELGIDCEVKEVFSFTYRTAFAENLYEYEFDHVLLGSYDGPVSLNEEEASEYRWIDIGELGDELVTHPERYSSWFLIAAPRVIKLVEGERG